MREHTRTFYASDAMGMNCKRQKQISMLRKRSLGGKEQSGWTINASGSLARANGP